MFSKILIDFSWDIRILLLSCFPQKLIKHISIYRHFGETVGSFPGHHPKANIAAEQVTDTLLFLSGSKSYVYMIFGPIVCYSII